MTTETNAERLERIKNLPTYTPFTITSVDINKIDIDWLIQQSERAQELEISSERCVKVAMNRQTHINQIESENAHLRKALEFYADEEKYEYELTYDMAEIDGAEILKDSGRIARAALNTQEDSI